MSVSARTVAALRRRHNWVQLIKFGVVGASGYVDRHADTAYLDDALVRWFADRPGFATDDRPVAQTPIVTGEKPSSCSR